MIPRQLLRVSIAAISITTAAGTALAQRPSGSQGPPEMSFGRAWAWFTARPGVMIAIAIIIAAIIYMVLTKKKPNA